MKLFPCLALMLTPLLAAVGAPLLENPGFEKGAAGWREPWSSEAGKAALTPDRQTKHGGAQAARLTHSGAGDWNLEPAARVAVNAGDVVEWSLWLKRDVKNSGAVSLCASLWGADGKVTDWFYGRVEPLTVSDWQLVRAWFVVPPGVKELQPRVAGSGAAELWLDDALLVKKNNPAAAPREPLTIRNAALEVTLNPADATLSILDRRSRRRYESVPLTLAAAPAADISTANNQLRYTFFNYAADTTVSVALRLDNDKPELLIELTADGDLTRPLRYPAPFATADGDRLILPLNEGIAYPVTDSAVWAARLQTYSGHGLCMAFWGVSDDAGRGHMTLVETPDDAAAQLLRHDGKLTAAAEWDAQRGKFGYARKLRLVFFNEGGHVAMAKRYRAHAQQTGLFKTLADKRRDNADIDQLVGAANIWSFLGDPVNTVAALRQLGVERILWSNAESAADVRALNKLHVLTGGYDIYQDIMNPALYPRLSYTDSHWIPEAWPGELILNADGQPIPGWEIKDKDGHTMHPCGVLCDRFAPDYARRRIREDLRTRPTTARFIDTTTASPWRECYAPAHPLTRGESRHWKMELLRAVSEDCRLVTGSETGHDAAVPYVAYFEGMMSLAPYRVPDSGREMDKIWHDIPPDLVNYQLNPAYRLPLWELVYHDCVIAHWYWGDYNNKLPALWRQRDLFNVLYATPPLLFLTREQWPAQKERFAQSCRDILPVARATGYSEMLDHRVLTADRQVQQTAFADGTVVTVNFSDHPHTLPDNTVVAPQSFHVRNP